MRTSTQTSQRRNLRISSETPENSHWRTYAETPPCAWSGFAYAKLWETPQRRNLRIYAHGSNMEFLRINAEFLSFLILEILRIYAELLRTAITVLRIDVQGSDLEFLRIYAELYTFLLSLLISEILACTQKHSTQLLRFCAYTHNEGFCVRFLKPPPSILKKGFKAPQYFYTDRSKAVLLLWFLTVLAVCVYTLVQLLC